KVINPAAHCPVIARAAVDDPSLPRDEPAGRTAQGLVPGVPYPTALPGEPGSQRKRQERGGTRWGGHQAAPIYTGGGTVDARAFGWEFTCDAPFGQAEPGTRKARFAIRRERNIIDMRDPSRVGHQWGWPHRRR